MNQLLLAPTDVLFFRDGRPIGGSLAGHGAAWPLPTVTNAALHAALWRSGLAERAHVHRRGRSGRYHSENLDTHGERFGSLVTAGPFPVCTSGAAHTWFFPAPADARCTTSDDGKRHVDIVLTPSLPTAGSASSYPLPLGVGSLQPPTKDKPSAWWSEGAWNAYLGTVNRDELAGRLATKNDAEFADTEAHLGIGIDAERGTQDGTSIYSAHYLRLREGWRLGVLTHSQDKTEVRGERLDLVSQLITTDARLLVGGQQRSCTAELTSMEGRRLPMPLGKLSGFSSAVLPTVSGAQPKYLVKWTLLSPAVFPEIRSGETADGRTIIPHRGGWLPTWISDDAGHRVLLPPLLAPRAVAAESRANYRARVRAQDSIAASLVAAAVPKPIPVTGWSLGDERFGEDARAGAKPTHLAVPAGAVYYFACDSEADARNLATALNWHGDTPGTAIRNRRSTQLGEKGFGLGVCGTWMPHPHPVTGS